FLVFLFWYMLPTFEKSILDKKRGNEREMVQIVWSLLDGYEERIAAGDLSPEKGRANAVKMIRNIRYGKNDANYFWINDLTPRLIMHPYRPDLEGMLVSDISDPFVKHAYDKIIEAIKESDSNYIEYTWQHNEDPSQLLPKISYVRLFKPWNWIIGTGSYVYAIQEEMNRFRMNIALMGAGILALLLFLSVWAIRQRFKTEAMRESAEAQIQNEKRKLLKIIEFLPDATFVIDKSHRVIAWNRAMEQMTGIPKDAILGKGDYEYAKPLYGHARPVLIDYVMQRDSQILTHYENFTERNGVISGEAFVPQFHNGHGGNALITASPLVDEHDQIAGAIESIRDITEQKKIEQAIRASEENYRTIFNGANEAFFIHDPETGAILDFNQKACEMCDIQNPDRIDDKITSFWKHDKPQEIEELMRRIREAAQGIDRNYEKLITNQAGRSFWVEANLKKIVLGGQDCVMAVLRDIHSRKIAEQEKTISNNNCSNLKKWRPWAN
ncbi:MAG: cache domain-containing protein, partial [Candidatus Omnitrophica bacterium]|nr:cache domain-containing protein [Candidatus Omnitrophota bacterium]